MQENYAFRSSTRFFFTFLLLTSGESTFENNLLFSSVERGIIAALIDSSIFKAETAE